MKTLFWKIVNFIKWGVVFTVGGLFVSGTIAGLFISIAANSPFVEAMIWLALSAAIVACSVPVIYRLLEAMVSNKGAHPGKKHGVT